jgi:hypothetical protein
MLFLSFCIGLVLGWLSYTLASRLYYGLGAANQQQLNAAGPVVAIVALFFFVCAVAIFGVLYFHFGIPVGFWLVLERAFESHIVFFIVGFILGFVANARHWLPALQDIAEGMGKSLVGEEASAVFQVGAVVLAFLLMLFIAKPELLDRVTSFKASEVEVKFAASAGETKKILKISVETSPDHKSTLDAWIDFRTPFNKITKPALYIIFEDELVKASAVVSSDAFHKGDRQSKDVLNKKLEVAGSSRLDIQDELRDDLMNVSVSQLSQALRCYRKLYPSPESGPLRSLLAGLTVEWRDLVNADCSPRISCTRLPGRGRGPKRH